MKNELFILMTGILCALILAAGCTGTPGTAPLATPPAAVTEKPAVTTSAAGSAPVVTPTLVERTWTGTWKIKWEANDEQPLMKLVQRGSSVAGTYDESGNIAGTAQDTRLVGTWTEGPESKGPLEFIMAADNMSFVGTYVSTGEKRFWDGTRVT
jgi:hypothetical protein